MFRIFYYFQTIKVRLIRFLCHLSYPIYKTKYQWYHPSSYFFEWIYDFPFYVMDVLAIPEIYEFIVNSFKWNTRKLNEEELTMATSIYQENIDYRYVKIDKLARFGTRKLALAYVSFNTINCYKTMSKETFIHEMMHIWQYQNFGSVYISRAIKAQNSKEGYDYGGVQNLYQSMLKNRSLIDFNFEQQADIIEDYYRLSLMSNISPMNLNIYTYYVNQLTIR